MTTRALLSVTGQKVPVISKSGHNQVTRDGPDRLCPFDDAKVVIFRKLSIFHEKLIISRKGCDTAVFLTRI